MPSDKQDFEEATEDWANVQEIVPNFQSATDRAVPVPDLVPDGQTPLVTIDQIIDDFRNQDLSEQLTQVAVDNVHLNQFDNLKHMMRKTVSCFKRSSPQTEKEEEEKRLILAIAKCPLDNSNPLHLKVLLTIYKRLTGETVDRPRYGSHWEQIGFQGSDPATDLRGIGFLGLIQALYFVMTPELLPLARDMYFLSRNETQEFPLMVLSINVTRIALHALRDDLLARQIIQEASTWSSFNYFYVALMFHIFTIWKNQHKTIKDSGYVLKDAEKYGRKNVRLLTAQLHSYLMSNK